MKRKEYTSTGARCAVVTIEAVFHAGEVNEMAEAIENALEDLRSFGHAEITVREYISDTFEEASKILNTRMVKE